MTPSDDQLLRAIYGSYFDKVSADIRYTVYVGGQVVAQAPTQRDARRVLVRVIRLWRRGDISVRGSNANTGFTATGVARYTNGSVSAYTLKLRGKRITHVHYGLTPTIVS